MTKEKIPRKILIRTFIVFVLMSALMNSIAHMQIRSQKNTEKQKASYAAEAVVRRMESQLNKYLMKSDMLKYMIESGEEMDNAKFMKWASYLQDDEGVLTAIELAENGIITQVYPMDHNEKVLGMDLFEHPKRKLEASLAMDNGQYTIAGPYDLEQGGEGAILLDPVYTSENGVSSFWGFSILVLDWDKFIKEVELDKLEQTSYYYRIYKKDITTDDEITIAQCGENQIEDAVEILCEVPNGSWYVEIAPKDGWISHAQLWLDTVLCVTLAFLLSVIYWQFAVRRYRERIYTQEMMKSEREARSANEAKTRFLFNMSHDIRTPMNAIIGFSNLIEKHIHNPEQVKDYLKKLQESSTLLLSIINHVLEMARIESGEITLNEQTECIPDIVQSIENVFETEISNKKIQCRFEADVEHEYIVCDKTKVREIFLNIIGNAVKYTKVQGKIHVQVKELPSDQESMARYRIVVEDNGIGMSEEYLPHVFEAFSREHSSTEARVEGTGLGLPIVKSLIDMMGGEISAESRPGEGTKITVEVSFPIADPQSLSDDMQTKREQLRQKWKDMRILLAEDNDLNAEIVTTLLQENSFEVERVADGRQCVKMVKNMPSDYYKLVLMDIQMPNMDGYEAAKQIRMLNGERAKIPIIAVTANAFDEDRQKAFAAGMDAHVVKPIDMEQLFDAFQTLAL